VLGVLCAYLILAAVYTHPVLQHSLDRIANDPYDPILNTSILWWNATTVPFSAGWWSPPYFYPARDVSAFTENLVGISVFASPVYWLTNNALAAYNIAFFLTWPLSAFTAYLLALFLVRRHDAAFLAGLAYGFTPYRTAELGHIQMLSSYWLPLCLLALHGFIEERRGRWLLLFAAAWILQSLANGYFIFFGAVLIGMWLLYFCSTTDAWRAAPAIVVTWGLANLPLLPIMMKYHAVHEQYGLRRTLGEALAFSAPASAWVEVSQVIRFWDPWLPESKDNLFPGVTAVTLVVVGLLLARWRRPSAGVSSRSRLIVIAALGIATAVSLAAILATLVLGPWRASLLGFTLRVTDLDRLIGVALWCGVPLLLLTTRIVEVLRRRPAVLFYSVATVVLGVLCCGPVLRAGDAVVLEPMPYRWLMYLPGFDQLRVPTRFWMLGTLCLGVAAGLSFARCAPERRRLRGAAFALVAAGLLFDGWTRGITMAVPPEQWPKVERRDHSVPILELPLGPDWDAAATFRGLRHRRGVVNGVSGYDPPHYAPLQDGLNSLDPAMLAALASLRSFDIVVNGAVDRDGRWGRYALSGPGAQLVATDGVRSAYRVPASPRQAVVLGATLPIVGVRASSDEGAAAAVDGDLRTEWHDNPQQLPGHYLVVDLGAVRDVGGVTQSLGEWARDFPRRLAIDVSVDGSNWDQVWEGQTAAMAFLAAVESPRGAPLRFSFDVRPARFVRLRTLAAHKNLWRVAEIRVHTTVGSRQSAVGSLSR